VEIVLQSRERLAMMWGALLGIVAGLVGYEIIRRDRSWDDGRWARSQPVMRRCGPVVQQHLTAQWRHAFVQ
jgi:hypothetical protein